MSDRIKELKSQLEENMDASRKLIDIPVKDLTDQNIEDLKGQIEEFFILNNDLMVEQHKHAEEQE